MKKTTDGWVLYSRVYNYYVTTTRLVNALWTRKLDEAHVCDTFDEAMYSKLSNALMDFMPIEVEAVWV